MDHRSSAAFDLLDSPDISAVNAFVENLKKYEKESWVVEHLITHYLETESAKAAELIVSAHSMHDKVIFKKLHSAFEDRPTRIASLRLLLYIVSKKPPWLHKIVNESIFNDLIRCMKNDNNAPVLMEAVYIITMLLPIVPDGMVRPFDSIFDSLIRLISFTFYNKEKVPEEFLLHLNVGIYSLFSRMYGMYPWHFVNSLQDYYMKSTPQREFYKQAIEPMLSQIKFNPTLITATKEKELRGDQWRRKEVHDIVADCASLSLDSTETTKDCTIRCPVLISSNQGKLIDVALKTNNVNVDVKLDSTDKLPHHLSAPIELAKDSLVSATINSSNFFSPSDRLGLSTPPPVEPLTPGFINNSQNAFNFTTPNNGTPQQVVMSLKTPHNTNRNTPAHVTPKDTPTTPLEDCSNISRSRHTSGNKGSTSRLSYDDPIPPSPLRKEFTNEPPVDVPRVRSVSTDSRSTAMTTDTLSVSNLHHLLEKISDTGSGHESDMTNNSDDEEVSSINQLLDMPTTQSVAEFMKNVNRIRFNSMTVTESEKSTPRSTKRPGSCPTFSEEIHEPIDSMHQQVERSASIQTKSSIDLVSKDDVDDLPANKGSNQTAVKCTSLTTTMLPTTATAAATVAAPSLTTMTLPLITDAGNTKISNGPGAMLDQHLLLLNDEIRLASSVHKQQTETANQSTVNWSHFGATTEVNILKGQLALLHTQLLYERQKRELHAERNRRLLSKIARAEKIREENAILKEKLRNYEHDIFNLEMTYRLQTTEIQKLKEDKARNEARSEHELSVLIKENDRLKYSKEELQRELESQSDECDQKTKQLAETVGKVEMLERDLYMSSQQVQSYHGFEEEVNRMKRELLLMGEIQIKYEEKLSALKYDTQVALSPEQEENFIKQITKLKETNSKNNESSQRQQKYIDLLNTKLKEKDAVIKEQYDLIERLRGEHSCKLQATEEKFKMSQAAMQSLQVEMMALHDQIGRLSYPASASKNNST